MPARTPITNPLPSDFATEEVAVSGRTASQRHQCLLEVWKTPGRTANEIAVAMGLKRHITSRRLPELRRTGQVKNGSERICAITGNPNMTWYPNVENNE